MPQIKLPVQFSKVCIPDNTEFITGNRHLWSCDHKKKIKLFMSFLFFFFFLTSYVKSPWSIDSSCLRERGLGEGNNRTHSYLLQGSKGFTLMMPLGTLFKQSVRIFTLIPLGMPTNRKPSSLRVNREVEIFWEPTVFNSAWLVSVLRTRGVSQSACLRPWPVASHIPLW